MVSESVKIQILDTPPDPLIQRLQAEELQLGSWAFFLGDSQA